MSVLRKLTPSSAAADTMEGTASQLTSHPAPRPATVATASTPPVSHARLRPCSRGVIPRARSTATSERRAPNWLAAAAASPVRESSSALPAAIQRELAAVAVRAGAGSAASPSRLDQSSEGGRSGSKVAAR